VGEKRLTGDWHGLAPGWAAAFWSATFSDSVLRLAFVAKMGRVISRDFMI
jgi:hypothetical protein